MLSLPRARNLIFTVCTLGYTILLTILESMKGPEAKVLYSHVLDELGKGLPGGKDKVKGMELVQCTKIPRTYYLDGVFGAMMQVDISNDVLSVELF
jgi:hypothetical protein